MCDTNFISTYFLDSKVDLFPTELCHINLFGLGEGIHCSFCQIKYLVYWRFNIYINLFSKLYSGFMPYNLFGLEGPGEGQYEVLYARRRRALGPYGPWGASRPLP
jgi:hypothetical protein